MATGSPISADRKPVVGQVVVSSDGTFWLVTHVIPIRSRYDRKNQTTKIEGYQLGLKQRRHEESMDAWLFQVLPLEEEERNNEALATPD